MIAPHEIAPAGPIPATMAAIPVLTTDRLILRAPQIGDFYVLADIGTGPRSAGIGGPYGREDMWFDYAQMTATWVWRGHGYWTVTDTSEDVLGFAGVGFEPGDQEPELGYMLRADAEGQGIATEAARAALDYVRHTKLVPSLVSYIFAQNNASQAVARRLGGTRDTYAEVALAAPEMTVWRYAIAGGHS